MPHQRDKIRVSMWSSYFKEFSPEEMVEVFAEHHCSYSELSDEHARMLLERGDPVKVGGEFREFAESCGVSFPQGHLYLAADIAHPLKSERRKTIEYLKLECELFAALGIKAAVLHPGGRGLRREGCSFDDIIQENLSPLREIIKSTAGSPTTICLENTAVAADDLMRLIEAVDDDLGVCLDTGHLNMMGGDCAAFVYRLRERIKALHVTDSIDEGPDHLLPHGAGTIRWEPFVQALYDTGYEGLFNFEVPKENKCPMNIRKAKLDYALELGRLMVQNRPDDALK